MVNTSLALTPQTRLLPTRDAGTAARYFRVAVPAAADARSGKSAGHFRLYAPPRLRLGAPRGRQQRAPDIDVPGKLGRGRPQPGRMPGGDGIRTGTVAPARGLCAPGTAHGRAPRATGCRGDAGEERSRTQLPGLRRAVAEGNTGRPRISSHDRRWRSPAGGPPAAASCPGLPGPDSSCRGAPRRRCRAARVGRCLPGRGGRGRCRLWRHAGRGHGRPGRTRQDCDREGTDRAADLRVGGPAGQ